MPPVFAPESTQFTNADQITVYCPESINENTSRFELYYTTDGGDPVTSTTRQKAEDGPDSAVIDITGYKVISAVIGADRLPVIPVHAVKDSTVSYEINGFSNKFICDTGLFYLDTATGNAYLDEEGTLPLGKKNEEGVEESVSAELIISSTLDGVDSYPNRYRYSLSKDPSVLAPPYADRKTGEYEEIRIDEDNHLLCVVLDSLNSGDTIEYRMDNQGEWMKYDGTNICLKQDTVLQLRSSKNGYSSVVVSYVYRFVPLSPIITLPSSRYPKTPVQTTRIVLDERAPTDKNYSIWFRANGDPRDYRYNHQERAITRTMSFKAYVLNEETGRVSANTIHYYIIESDFAPGGRVYVASPYDVPRISADLLDTGEYANGIKLLTQNNQARIHYYYSYTKVDTDKTYTTGAVAYDNAAPIMVNASMKNITITAWLEDENGRIGTDNMVHTVDFIHLKVPETSLGSEKVDYDKGTTYTLTDDYPGDETVLLYYTLDGSEPKDSGNPNRKQYNGEKVVLNEASTVKAVYFSACGKCVECKNRNEASCWYGVYGKNGIYKYTVPTVKYTGGGGGSAGGSTGGVTVDKTRKYTRDIFGIEQTTHIGYINGYPDGSVQPEGQITREEMAAILYRIQNRQYDKPFVATGEIFPDVAPDRWSVSDIEYMADKGVIIGYPDGSFKPSGKLTRAEFAALICRYANLNRFESEPVFQDLETNHWAYGDIMTLYRAGLLEGYEDGSVRADNEITRAEAMKVINRLLGRNPSEPYVKTLNYNPFSDLSMDKWYSVVVLEATVTHSYYLNDYGLEIKWEDCR